MRRLLLRGRQGRRHSGGIEELASPPFGGQLARAAADLGCLAEDDLDRLLKQLPALLVIDAEIDETPVGRVDRL